MSDIIVKLMILWSKSKLQYAKITKETKTMMPYNKNNNTVRNKPKKLNVPYVKSHEPSMNTTTMYANKKWPSDESSKKKQHALRSA